MNSRETIYAGLFSRVSTAANFTTISRRLKHWNDVAPANQPALFQAQKSEDALVSPGLNTKWRLRLDLYVYAHTGGDPSSSPGSVLNPLLDAVTAVFAPDNLATNKCTLGGLVEHAWIEGTIETDEGYLGDQGVAIIPVSIVTA